MRSIDLATYKVTNPSVVGEDVLKDLEAVEGLYQRLVALPEESADGEVPALGRIIQEMKAGLAKEIDYDVKNSLIEVLFAPNQGLGARDILDRDDLARLIRDWPDAVLLLEDAQYDKIKQAADSVRGFTRNDVEFLRRVLQAPKVDLKNGGKP